MRSIYLAPAALAASVLFAAPAMAGSLTVEARGGLNWASVGSTKAVVGAAVGYEMDLSLLGTGVFGGVEQNIEKASSGGGDARWGTSARVGAKILGLGAVYGVAGYHYGSGVTATSIGAGYQRAIGPVFGKLEYRHYINQGGVGASNSLGLGVGFKF